MSYIIGAGLTLERALRPEMAMAERPAISTALVPMVPMVPAVQQVEVTPTLAKPTAPTNPATTDLKEVPLAQAIAYLRQILAVAPDAFSGGDLSKQHHDIQEEVPAILAAPAGSVWAIALQQVLAERGGANAGAMSTASGTDSKTLYIAGGISLLVLAGLVWYVMRK